MEIEPQLAIPPYLDQLSRRIEAEEPEAWAWLSESLHTPEYVEEVRLQLLKSTYRMEEDEHAALYASASVARERLGITAPVTLYVAQQAVGANASLLYLPGELHVVFQGSVLSGLTEPEQTALLGHEFSHFLFLERADSRFRTVDELLSALVHDRNVQPAQLESYRAFCLFMEVFCDRGALVACGELSAAVGMLVKIEAGLTEISAESYLRQTDEIFAKQSDVSTQGLSHPEAYIRARSLQLWHAHRDAAEPEIERMIRGGIAADGLDMLRQEEICALTRQLLCWLLREPWMRTQSVLSHAQLYFDGEDFAPVLSPDAELPPISVPTDEKLQMYFCYVLLDFATCDRSIEEPALAHTYLLADQLSLKAPFTAMLKKELKLKVRQIDELCSKASEIVARARSGEGKS